MTTFTQAFPSRVTAPPPRIGTRRAYGELIGLFLIVLGAAVINAFEDGWTAVSGKPPSWLAWWDHWASNVRRALFVVGVFWLISLRPWRATGIGTAAAGLAAIAGLRATGVALAHQAPTVAISLGYLADTALTVTLAGVLAYRRGLTLATFGLGRESKGNRRAAFGTAMEVFFASFVGIEVASVASKILKTLSELPSPPGRFAVNGIHDIPNMIISSINAGVCEEIILAATVVTALEAARRPVWQIFATGMVMRLAIHLYFGVSAPAALILAGVNIWLFRRTRRLMPLITAHIFVDLFALITILGGPLALPCLFAALSIIYSVIACRPTPHEPSQEQS